MRGIHPDTTRDLDELIAHLEHALDIMPVEQMPGLLSQLERLWALIWVKLMIVPVSGTRENPGPDRLLDVSEAAHRLGVSKDYLYRHAKRLPFALRIGPGQLRFSERGLERWIKTRVGRVP
ncbi:MAG: helix-turn-helix domain-containing protein [Nitrospinae bacterium]|nr:helix-turn-helix domain-containing protein [Nitrospinota bacterium]